MLRALPFATIALLACAPAPMAQPDTPAATRPPEPCAYASDAGVEHGAFPEGTFRGDHGGHECAFATDHLHALKEQPLTLDARRRPEVYRLLWLRSFDPPISIRLEILPDESGTLTAKVGIGKGGYAPEGLRFTRDVIVTPDELKEFRAVLAGSNFWQPGAKKPRPKAKRALRLTQLGWREERKGMVAPIVYRPKSLGEGVAITGRVTDLESGQPVLLTTVVASSASLGDTSEFSDAEGRYQLSGLPAGPYTLTFVYGDLKLATVVETQAALVAQVETALDLATVEQICVDGADWILEGVKDGATQVYRQRCETKDVPFHQPALWLINHAHLTIMPYRIY